MIPILEVQGYFALFIATLIVLSRIYYCCKMYDIKFIIEILIMAILTSILWICYCVYKSNKSLMYQFILSIFVYFIVVVYLKFCCNSSKSKSSLKI